MASGLTQSRQSESFDPGSPRFFRRGSASAGLPPSAVAEVVCREVTPTPRPRGLACSSPGLPPSAPRARGELPSYATTFWRCASPDEAVGPIAGPGAAEDFRQVEVLPFILEERRQKWATMSWLGARIFTDITFERDDAQRLLPFLHPGTASQRWLVRQLREANLLDDLDRGLRNNLNAPGAQGGWAFLFPGRGADDNAFTEIRFALEGPVALWFRRTLRVEEGVAPGQAAWPPLQMTAALAALLRFQAVPKSLLSPGARWAQLLLPSLPARASAVRAEMALANVRALLQQTPAVFATLDWEVLLAALKDLPAPVAVDILEELYAVKPNAATLARRQWRFSAPHMRALLRRRDEKLAPRLLFSTKGYRGRSWLGRPEPALALISNVTGVISSFLLGVNA